MTTVLVAEGQNNQMEATMADLRIKAVAERLNVSYRTVLRWIKDEETPFPNAYQQNPYLETSPWLIPEADVEAFEKMRGSKRESNGSN